jgi:alpha-tubulin suppressor-like RCC1 family protein
MVISSKGQVYTCGRGYKVCLRDPGHWQCPSTLEPSSHAKHEQGFLGHKNQNNIRSFLLVDALASLKVTQVCAARNHSLVVSTLIWLDNPLYMRHH